MFLLWTGRVILQDDHHALRKTFTPTFHSRFCKVGLKDERRPALRTTKWITAGWSESSRDVRSQPEGELLIYWARWTLIHLQAKQTKGSHLPCDDFSLRDAIWNCNYHVKDKMRANWRERPSNIPLLVTAASFSALSHILPGLIFSPTHCTCDFQEFLAYDNNQHAKLKQI